MNDEKSGNENRKLVQTNQSVDLLATVPGSFGTAATVVVQYERNKVMNECAENTALDDETAIRSIPL
jgi:hypothetical protein